MFDWKLAIETYRKISKTLEYHDNPQNSKAETIDNYFAYAVSVPLALGWILLMLPRYLGRQTECHRRRMWRFKIVWVAYAGVAVGAYAHYSLGYTANTARLTAALLPSMYLSLALPAWFYGLPEPVSRVRERILDPTAKDEYEIPMDVRKSCDSAPSLPHLKRGESTAAIGASRSGKTTALKLLACQLDYRDSAVIVHGSEGEYSEFFRDELGMDVVRIGINRTDAHWNLFEEAESERDLEIIARGLFRESEDNYFESAARQVFSACLVHLYRKYDNPDHSHIRQLLDAETVESVHEALRQHSDLKSAAEHVDPDANEQTQGVFGTLHQQMDDLFVGEFVESGSFSFREYVRNPRGRVVVVESPEVSRGVGPMYRALLDEAIARSMKTERPNVLLLDEIDEIAALSNLPDLAARGLAQGSRMMIGCQTVGQLRDVYGDSTEGILGNCNQILGFYAGSDCGETIEFYQSLLGKQRQTIQTESVSKQVEAFGDRTTSVSEREEDRYPLTTHELANEMDNPGDALVVQRDGWWWGHIEHYEVLLERAGTEQSASDGYTATSPGTTGTTGTATATATDGGTDDWDLKDAVLWNSDRVQASWGKIEIRSEMNKALVEIRHPESEQYIPEIHAACQRPDVDSLILGGPATAERLHIPTAIVCKCGSGSRLMSAGFVAETEQQMLNIKGAVEDYQPDFEVRIMNPEDVEERYSPEGAQ